MYSCVGEVLEEALDILFFVLIMVIFRLRPVNIYYLLAEDGVAVEPTTTIEVKGANGSYGNTDFIVQ